MKGGAGGGGEREREREREETQIDGVFREGVWGTQRTTHKRAGEDEDPHKVDVGGGTGSTAMQTDMSHSASNMQKPVSMLQTLFHHVNRGCVKCWASQRILL